MGKFIYSAENIPAASSGCITINGSEIPLSIPDTIIDQKRLNIKSP